MEKAVQFSDDGSRRIGGVMKAVAVVAMVAVFGLLTGCCMLHPMW